ncbi:MAG: ATP-grasp domain-containing protein [Thaumarchaeota archaeon]|nr:ATP-grasp domain-containing protein [Nitrososphaerota archaeon]
MPKGSIPVLVAGIGGASLGTEVIKSLMQAGIYSVFGCDISPYAFGHYQGGIAGSLVVKRENYAESLLDLCTSHEIRVVIPGGEEPASLLSESASLFREAGIHLAMNSQDVVAVSSDKKRLFERLKELGIPIPLTVAVSDMAEYSVAPSYPVVIKPTTGSGGSSLVFIASNPDEERWFVKYLLNNGRTALVQEYIAPDEGEFTVGVLSLPDRRVVGSVAMRRLFNAKLSVLIKTEAGVISSGYSQGLIDDFPEVQARAEEIAKKSGSVGPMNIQGRVRDGVLIPFEINARFSASTYLRAMAGFNEVDLYLRHVLLGEHPAAPRIRPGYYLRSLSEVAVGKEEIKQ